PVAARWDGTQWSLLHVPSPDGTVFSGLDGVSCPAVSACTAVGSYTTTFVPDEPIPIQTLAERWDGTAWTIQPTPLIDFPSGFTSVSCPTLTSCTAVGAAILGTYFADQWNGQEWTVTLGENRGLDQTMFGVSCTSASACLAIGQKYSLVLGYDVQLALGWDGSQWSDVTPSGGSSRVAVCPVLPH